VPTRIYFKGPHAKVELALARGKVMHDKRRSIKEREQRREIDRALSERG
jgi:SsrA-binding protein